MSIGIGGGFRGRDIPNYFIHESKEAEPQNVYEAKSWLLVGKSLFPQNFQLQFQAYLLEKRLQNVEGAASCFESLFNSFLPNMKDEIGKVANAVRTVQLTKGKETEEQMFLQNIFNCLSKDTQREVLLQKSETTTVLFEKCQFILLLVQLYPDTVNQTGADLLFTLLACESDAFSTFRKLLVVELVPSILKLGKNLGASPRLLALLSQCVEYYVLVGGQDEKTESSERWGKLHSIVDQIGSILSWNSAPFFSTLSQTSGPNNVEAVYQGLLKLNSSPRNLSQNELGYTAVVIFLKCIVGYHELINNCSSEKFGEKSKLVLVEIFTPRRHRSVIAEHNLPVITTVSNCSSIGGNQSQVLQYFLTASKIWQLVNSSNGDSIKKEFFPILCSMNSLNLDKWNVFQEFYIDFQTYTGQHFQHESMLIQNNLKIASLHCSVSNYKAAAEYVIKSIVELQQEVIVSNSDTKTSLPGPFPFNNGDREDFSFFNEHVYSADQKGGFITQRRVHFLSENRTEIIAYASNILIRCFHEILESSAGVDDCCIGHLITLLQLEWPSPPAEMIFTQILEIIRRKGNFSYFPFFADFVIEPDFLEQFMAMANHEGKTVNLDIWSMSNGNHNGGSRRVGTRGVEKGARNDFRTNMKRQMLKNGKENLHSLIVNFLTSNKSAIISCFEASYK